MVCESCRGRTGSWSMTCSTCFSVALLLLEGRRSVKQLVIGFGAQTVDINRGRQGFLGARLFWRHVAWGADDGARLRQAGITLDAFGQSEDGNVGLAIAIEQDIAWLQITVKNAALVGVVNGPGDSREQPGSGALILGEERQTLRQAAAFNQLHGEIVLALMLTNLVDRYDVGRIWFGKQPLLRSQKLLDIGWRSQIGQREIIFNGDDSG